MTSPLLSTHNTTHPAHQTLYTYTNIRLMPNGAPELENKPFHTERHITLICTNSCPMAHKGTGYH